MDEKKFDAEAWAAQGNELFKPQKFDAQISAAYPGSIYLAVGKAAVKLGVSLAAAAALLTAGAALLVPTRPGDYNLSTPQKTLTATPQQ